MAGSDVEAKVVVLGSQGVGKTSLVHRYVKNAFANTTSTVGASFLTKKVTDIDTSTVVRLQIWDTAGQERYRSISKLYYRGANAAVLCYDITDPKSFEEMGRWLIELKNNLGDGIILHVVGTKVDRVAEDPSARKVPFERCIAYVAENLFPQQAQQDKQPTSVPKSLWGVTGVTGGGKDDSGMASPQSNRSSGFWGQDVGWDCCHEISAKDGEGVEEVFRVITRKLVEQRNKTMEQDFLSSGGVTPALNGGPGQAGYFDYSSGSASGSFRVGMGDKRRSWLGFPTPSPGLGGPMQTPGGEEWSAEIERTEKKGSRCC